MPSSEERAESAVKLMFLEKNTERLLQDRSLNLNVIYPGSWALETSHSEKTDNEFVSSVFTEAIPKHLVQTQQSSKRQNTGFSTR